jgi:Family of unknown function (DUF6010)
MSASHPLLAGDYYGPAIGALCFVFVMSRVPEPARRTFNSIFVAGTCGAYLNGGFGRWELVYPLQSSAGHARCVCGAPIVPIHRTRMDHARRLGLGAPFVG